MFSDLWMQDLKGTFNVPHRQYRMNWLLIAWVFNQEQILSEITAFVPRISTDTIDSGDLPIAKEIIDAMNEGRYEYIENVLDIPHDFHESLIHGRVKCLQEGREGRAATVPCAATTCSAPSLRTWGFLRQDGNGHTLV
ncbi:hypothetical protein BJY00DRAFT_310572 [Aspergillus carlsbadensis]|nr:hypothetical protein BJY00DRAFT_310572 [Aspergillus carlsbadensis]